MLDSEHRLWLFRRGNEPAWTLDTRQADAAWTHYESLKALISSKASSTQIPRLAARLNDESSRPAWHANGQAFLWSDGEQVSLFKDGSWQTLPQPKGSIDITGVRFSEEGHPEVILPASLKTNRVWRYSELDGWTDQGTQPSRYARKEEADKKAAIDPPAEVFQDILPPKQIWPKPTHDPHGTWWLLKDGAPWRSDQGISRRALPANLRMPWNRSDWTGFHTVRKDTQGNYYFWIYSDVVIVPARLLEPVSG